jgi:hypothetical protein
MKRRARRSGLVMGFDIHMIAGSRACSTFTQPIHPTITKQTSLHYAEALSKVLTPPLRYISVVLGTISLTSTVLGLFLLKWGPVAELGKGGIERWLVYPVVLWLTVFGGYFMGSRTIKAPSEAERLGSSATGQNGKVPVKASSRHA